MKRLPFERRFRLETSACESCAGTGTVECEVPRHCRHCRGLGRVPSEMARHLFREICALVGADDLLDEDDSRIDPLVLQLVRGDSLRVGMQVAPRLTEEFHLVTAVRDGEMVEERFIGFSGGNHTWIRMSPCDVVHRELTDEELSAIDALMERSVGRGAVPAPRDH